MPPLGRWTYGPPLGSRASMADIARRLDDLGPALERFLAALDAEKAPVNHVHNAYDLTTGVVTAGRLNGVTGLTIAQASPLLATSVALTNGAGAAAGTLLNAPAAGNPTKWVALNDNGTTRYLPLW